MAIFHLLYFYYPCRFLCCCFIYLPVRFLQWNRTLKPVRLLPRVFLCVFVDISVETQTNSSSVDVAVPSPTHSVRRPSPTLLPSYVQMFRKSEVCCRSTQEKTSEIAAFLLVTVAGYAFVVSSCLWWSS